MDLTMQERERGGVLNMDTEIVSTIISHGPGYLNKDLEKIVGVQTDEPFKRSMQPFGGIRMAAQALESYGYEIDKEVEEYSLTTAKHTMLVYLMHIQMK
jgi:formate C-acetyltransferase